MSTSSSSSATLLIEVFTEELPPKSLRKLGDAFAASLSASIQAAGLSTAESVTTSFASPRRLAVQITHVLSKAADFPVREKVLPVSVAFDANGKPTPPLFKKLSALGYPDIDIASLERSGQDKNEALYLNVQARGAVLENTVQTALAHALQTLPIAKMMHYQVQQADGTLEDVEFARPAHRIVALHGSTPLQVHALGIHAANQTEGHRFLAPSVLTIGHADQYAAELLKNKVMANFNERRAYIEAELLKAAKGDAVLMPSNLLDEVTALVEWPAVYACHFDAEFLEVPQECLILTMQTNQKYFALTDAAGKLRNRFLIVSNIETTTPQSIIQGNERVVRPRLSDARFFFQQDQKRPLSSRVADLGKVVYHNQLGTQLDRTKR
ncbi:MAG: glycine--tRNA ligase subunit beta, partial [Polynucleobacter sp.]